MRIFLLFALLFAPGWAHAQDRSVMLTSFERIRVEGPYRVTVTTGTGTRAVVSGSDRARSGVSLRVEGQTLIIRADRNDWGGYPGAPTEAAAIAVSTPMLRSVQLSGGADVRIDRIRAQRVDLSLTGSGTLTVASVESDQLQAALTGTGRIRVAGTAGRARFQNNGTGEIDAGELVARDLTVLSQSAGPGRYAARFTADISSNGVGEVVVLGGAKCNARGVGPVRCGAGAPTEE